jgi:hypothetical protein
MSEQHTAFPASERKVYFLRPIKLHEIKLLELPNPPQTPYTNSPLLPVVFYYLISINFNTIRIWEK